VNLHEILHFVVSRLPGLADSERGTVLGEIEKLAEKELAQNTTPEPAPPAPPVPVPQSNV
jgi:hypothetical protein